MKLYTQTVCPKCMLVKMWIDTAGLTDVKYINLDEHENVREELKSKGFTSLPILEVNGEFYTDQNDIQEIINN